MKKGFHAANASTFVYRRLAPQYFSELQTDVKEDAATAIFCSRLSITYATQTAREGSLKVIEALCSVQTGPSGVPSTFEQEPSVARR